MSNFSEKVAFIWSVADLLRGPYKPHQYGRVILPLTALRRLDCVLEPTKQKVLEKHAALKSSGIKDVEPILNRAAGLKFHNTSKLDFQKLKGDPDKVAQNLTHYIKSFSSKARQIFEFFEFEKEIAKLAEADRLFLVVQKFAEIDLHPDKVPNHEMGLVFEDLIRRFNEASNETAGDHFTPREVIRLMVNLLLTPDSEMLRTKGIVKTLYDPACGTGGMLSVSEEYLRELNPDARLEVFGQDYNNEAYAICCSDMMIKGQDPENIKFGDSFTQDGLPNRKFDYLLANPPFGVEWKPQADAIQKEHDEKGFNGRFGPGLPCINDGSLLFIMQMISKMKPEPEQQLIDSLCARFVTAPESLDVVVASNLFGDIVTDLGAAIAGSMGLAPSANLNPEGHYPSLFQAIHGSAPGLAGKGIADPVATIWSVAMMLDHLDETELAAVVLAAVESVIAAGKVRTPDLGGSATTRQMGQVIIATLRKPEKASQTTSQ